MAKVIDGDDPQMKRKIIQIATEYLGENYLDPSTVLALCDDGTVWRLNANRWDKLPDIPQDTTYNYYGGGNK